MDYTTPQSDALSSEPRHIREAVESLLKRLGITDRKFTESDASRHTLHPIPPLTHHLRRRTG